MHSARIARCAQLAVTLSAAALAALAAPAVAAPPANDDFANAVVLSNLASTTPGTTVEATAQAGEPGPSDATPLRSVWYSWTPTSSERVTMHLCDAPTYDTILAVYTGATVNSLSQVAENDDADDGFCAPEETASRVVFNATSGTTYRIQVVGFAGSTGNFTLRVLPHINALVPDPAGAVDFGSAPVGSLGATRTVRFVNTGTTTVNPQRFFYKPVAKPATLDYMVVESHRCTEGSTIPPDAACVATFRFAPAALGPRPGQWGLDTGASTALASLSGTGLAPSSGPPGAQGPQGPAGQDGAQGPKGDPGRDAVVTCKVGRVKKKRVKVTCTVMLKSGGAGKVHAELRRRGRIYAVGQGRAKHLHLRATRRIASGRYTLVVTAADGSAIRAPVTL